MPFIMNVISKRTIIAAVASIINPFCGRDNQLKICIGITVKSLIGLVGMLVTYNMAPITISGADSPMALDTAKITPVTNPQAEAGNT